MSYSVKLTPTAEEHMRFWQMNDTKTRDRIFALIDNMQATPYTGIGQPEALRHKLNGKYSRRIDKKNRLVYSVDEEARIITIYQLRHHY